MLITKLEKIKCKYKHKYSYALGEGKSKDSWKAKKIAVLIV